MADNIGKGVSKFIADIRKNLDAKSRDELSRVAAEAGAELIRNRTRQGYGIANDGGSIYKLKPLSASYIEYRQRSILSPHTSPGKSNLTFTGQLLDSLTSQRKQLGTWQIILKGTHSKAGIPNSQLAKYVSRSRPFMFLSGGEIEKIRSLVRRTFRELVKSKN